MTGTRPLADLLRLGIGPLVWFAHFSLSYAAEGVICRPPNPSPAAMLWFGAVTTMLALTYLVVFGFRARRGRDQTDALFLRQATILLTILSALGVIWTAVPIIILRACS